MLVVGRGLSARRKAPRCAREMNRGMSCADGGSEHTHPLWLGAPRAASGSNQLISTCGGRADVRSGISPRLGARRARPVTVGLFPAVFANTPEREGGAAREDRRQQRPTPGLRLSENALEWRLALSWAGSPAK